MEQSDWRSREARLAALLTAAVLLLRFYFSRKVSFCGTPDSCQYLQLAESLATLGKFQSRSVFDLQLQHSTLPNPGIEYWRPGTSLLLQLARPFGGVNLHSSLAVATLAGVVLALAAWHMARHSLRDRRWALASYALCLLLPPVWTASLSPDSLVFYAAAVAWFLALFTVRRQGLLQDVLALLCIAAAYVIRNDAGLLLLPFLAVLWGRHRRQASTPAQNLLLIAGFLLALAPMHLLYRSVMGQAFPPGAGQALYLFDLGDLARYRTPVDAHTLMAHGFKALLMMRLTTTPLIVYRFFAVLLGYPALIFLVALAFLPRRGDNDPSLPELTGPVAMGLTTLVVYSLLLPAIGMFSALRTGAALLPFLSVLCLVAVARCARTLRAAAVLGSCLIAAYGLSGIMEDRRDVEGLNSGAEGIRVEAAQLRAMGADPAGNSVIMINNAVQFTETSGFPAVWLPINGLDAVAAAAHDFRVTHVVLDSEHLPGTPAEIQRVLAPVRTVAVPGSQALLLELPPQH